MVNIAEVVMLRGRFERAEARHLRAQKAANKHPNKESVKRAIDAYRDACSAVEKYNAACTQYNQKRRVAA